MSIQRYDFEGIVEQFADGDFVLYADHVAEVDATFNRAYAEGVEAGLAHSDAEAMRAACVAAVSALAVQRGGSDGSPSQMLYMPETLAALREVQP